MWQITILDRITWNNQPHPPNCDRSHLVLVKRSFGRQEEMRCLWKRPEAKFCYCLKQMKLFEKFKYRIINKKSSIE